MVVRKCKICDYTVKKEFVYCPMCGTRLVSSGIVVGYSLDRARYLWERRDGGKIIFKNFKIVRDLDKAVFSKSDPIRPRLGDFEHINLFNLRQFSFLYANPDQIYDMYNIGKLIGYYNVNAALKETEIMKLVDKLNKIGPFWRLFESKILQDKYEEGWKRIGCALIKLKRIDKRERKLVYVLSGCPTSTVHASHPTCFMLTGTLCGMAEGLFRGIWDGKENKCQAMGDSYNEVEIYLHEREEKPEIESLTKEELDKILNEIVGNSVDRLKIRPEYIGDLFYIIVSQVMNYYLVSLSPGHKIISKYTGRICGEKIAKEAEVHGLRNALTYLEDLFLYLKAGILRPEENADRIVIKMQESVYASGVSNIDTELCIFLAGIIEGFLNVATGERWDVTEMKCIASGFPECEFHCKVLNQYR